MEGYTARDALIVMRLDLTESLHAIQEELAEVEETLEFTGIADVLLGEDEALTAYPAIKRWLEMVSNGVDLSRDREELRTEQEEIVSALQYLEQRLRRRE